jgi:hypothetical protein
MDTPPNPFGPSTLDKLDDMRRQQLEKLLGTKASDIKGPGRPRKQN